MRGNLIVPKNDLDALPIQRGWLEILDEEPRPPLLPRLGLGLAAPFLLVFSILWGAVETFTPKFAFKIEAHWKKFLTFSFIGGTVFLLGLMMQWTLVKRIGPLGSYAGQAVFSIELSFFLNRWITWRDRDINLGVALIKWNTQKILMTLPNFALYAGLIFVGLNWLVANLTVTATFTVVNYVGGDKWSFGSRKSRTAVIEKPQPFAIATMVEYAPTVSAVIPCKNNPDTIRATVDALFAQEYPLTEIIVVGDIKDPTYASLADITDSRLIILEQEPTPGHRDPNVKRYKGIQKSSGEVIALVDSDIVMGSDWLRKAVTLLGEQDGGLVAGGMRSIHNSFWGRFVDRNTLAAKTPRISEPYQVTAKNFGKRGFKPPVTANAVFTREMFDECSLDARWAYGYEDYEWFWRLAQGNHKILFSDDLTASHHHRRSFRGLFKEYRQAAHGCAHFMRTHPDSPLARKRKRQAYFLPTLAVACLMTLCLAMSTGHALLMGAVIGIFGLLVLGREMIAARSIEAVVYPVAGLGLGMAFTSSMIRSYVTIRGEYTNGGEDSQAAQPIRYRYRFSHKLALALMSIIAGAVLLRCWQLSTQPDWQVDEVTYTTIAKNLLYFHRLSLPPEYLKPWTPFLFHPPFYFLLLSKWFALVGASIYKARLLGVLCTAITLSLLSCFIWREYGPKSAVITTLFIATDGWLLYVQRVSYMENVLMVMIVATILVYQKALEAGRWRWFVATGILAGCSAIFKHTGAYIIVALVLGWLLARRHHRKHATALSISGVIVLLYVWYMIHTDGLQEPFTKPFVLAWGRNNYYVQQSLVQLERTIGLQKAGGGSLTSISQFVHLLLSPMYIMFVPSFLVTIAALFLLGRTYIRCYKSRSLAPIGGHIPLTAWATAGSVVFGVIALKFSQYFMLFLLPLYCYLWTYMVEAVQHRSVSLRKSVLVFGVVGVVLAGFLSFQIRVHSSPGNVLREAISYVRKNVPKNALVISATPVAYALSQKWCTQRDPNLSRACLNQADYLVTWQTYLQPINPENIPGFGVLLKESVKLKTIQGFNGEIVIWRVNRNGKLADNGGRASSAGEGESTTCREVLQHPHVLCGLRESHPTRAQRIYHYTGAKLRKLRKLRGTRDQRQVGNVRHRAVAVYSTH